MADAAKTGAEGLVYRYRPRAVGGECAFRLGSHSLEWNIGWGEGRIAYPMIARVRLGYRPSNIGGRRFVAEIWPRGGTRIEIASSSYRSLFAMQDQGKEFRAFIGELHRRIAASGGDCQFEAGFAPWRWWPMAAIGAVTAAGLVYIALRTLAAGDLGASLVVAAFIALFAWQVGPLILRNRPRAYSPNAIPEDVLPNG